VTCISIRSAPMSPPIPIGRPGPDGSRKRLDSHTARFWRPVRQQERARWGCGDLAAWLLAQKP
jgi:hypothetical protein